MPPLPVISGREAAKAFRKIGFLFHPQKGGHMIYYRSDGRHLSIPDRRASDWKLKDTLAWLEFAIQK